MKPVGSGESPQGVISAAGLQALIDILIADGYTVVAPRVGDGAITLGTITSASELPLGYRDEQEAAVYRLHGGGTGGAFDHATPAQGWKRYLYPPVERLWQAEREGAGFRIVNEEEPAPRYAFFGVRACDLNAIGVLDVVFNSHGGTAEPRYLARRDAMLIIGVNCTRSVGSCFCASMGTGPRIDGGADVTMTELADDGGFILVSRATSDKGADLLRRVPMADASAEQGAAADAAVDDAARTQQRAMVADVYDLLKANIESRQWAHIAGRCLGCANCTMVCPTCFCGTVEDSTDLSGNTAERWRKWDSCFTIDFSYLHGGSIRRAGSSRYRQWMTHKLAYWWDQFGSSGCVGCGRCITWCPVGIDITEEAQNMRDGMGG